MDNFMKKLIVLSTLILGLSTSVWASVQTDTHTYIVSKFNNKVLAINRQTGQENLIPVGKHPKSMVLYGAVGYVANEMSKKVSLIDLTTNTVTQAIRVGKFPKSMKIHGDKGYVVNQGSQNISVIDLTSNSVIQTIDVANKFESMVLHQSFGYLINRESNAVTVLDLSTNSVDKVISVGSCPQSIVFHKGMGYVMNLMSHNVSVIDLTTNIVTQTICVRKCPISIVLHGDRGYVVNIVSQNISVIDLTSNKVIQTIPVGDNPQPMVVYGNTGYVVNHRSQNVTVIDLTTNTVIGTFDNPQHDSIDFSDTHVYLGLKKARPHFPTLGSINLVKAEKTLGEFVAMMPEIFQLGEIEPRLLSKEMNGFDTLKSEILAQNLFWDLVTNKPLMDPKDILATLVTMKYPQKFLKTKEGAWLRERLHMAFFQTVWSGDKDKAKTMLTYFVQLQDPVITKLATYTFKIGAGNTASRKGVLDQPPLKKARDL